jgi:hypothetical protein
MSVLAHSANQLKFMKRRKLNIDLKLLIGILWILILGSIVINGNYTLSVDSKLDYTTKANLVTSSKFLICIIDKNL